MVSFSRDGHSRRMFFPRGSSLADLRRTADPIIAADAWLTIDGQPVAPEDESDAKLADGSTISLGGAPPEPRLPLLVIAPGADPQPFEWIGGSTESTLADLRQSLGNKGAPGPFLDEANTPVEKAMEPFEKVSVLGTPTSGARLRVRFGSSVQQPADGMGANTIAASSAAGATAAALEALASERLALRQTRDMLSILGETQSAGGPLHWFDALDRDTQSKLLRSFRHLHGLRFVWSGHEGGQPSFELDRSVRPALYPSGDSTAVLVVAPVVTTRFIASAADNATAESVSALTSWNVNGSIRGEAGSNSVALKASYSEKRTNKEQREEANLIIRVDYLVARGEIVVDPDLIRLPDEVTETVRALRLSNAAPTSRDFIARMAMLMERYGAYVPLRTIFGGKLAYRQVRQLTATDRRDAIVREAQAEVEASVNRAGMTAGGGTDQGSTEQSATEQSSQRFQVTMVGGDPALVTTPYRWADSLDHYAWWAPISFADVRPLFSFVSGPDRSWLAAQLVRSTELAEALGGPIDWMTYSTQILADDARRTEISSPSEIAASGQPKEPVESDIIDE
jgi:hypothetical protein